LPFSIRECTISNATNKTRSNPFVADLTKEKGMVIKKRLILLGLSCWVFAACQPVSVPPIATSTLHPTNTPQPTITPLPANTPTPRPTLAPVIPTPTIPPPAVLTKYLGNVHIVKVDPFDDPSGWNAGNEISNGVLQLVGEGGDVWYGLSRNALFREGDGVVINFKFTRGGLFEMYLENGAWNTDPYKRFGVYAGRGHSGANLFTGKEARGSSPLPGNLYLNSNTWYSLFMVIGKEGDFLALIWDPSKPEKSLRYREVIKNWKGLNWQFHIQVNEGIITFDDFEEIEFDGIK
jgi:hypothetical protein